jgi:pyridoxamine 5'-phosphate oxidase
MTMKWKETPLHRKDLKLNPFEQFDTWYKEVVDSKSLEYPDAVCLSTLSPDGYPEGRIVLLKGYDDKGFQFFTNFQSLKGKSLEIYPKASMTFHWQPFHRQVRITGDVKIVTPKESDKYFASRPRLSKIGAWASKQSRVLESREVLETKINSLLERFIGQDVPRPAYWQGYRLIPKRIEFWQERENRLHDRFLYTRDNHGWKIERLYP